MKKKTQPNFVDSVLKMIGGEESLKRRVDGLCIFLFLGRGGVFHNFGNCIVFNKLGFNWIKPI